MIKPVKFCRNGLKIQLRDGGHSTQSWSAKDKNLTEAGSSTEDKTEKRNDRQVDRLGDGEGEGEGVIVTSRGEKTGCDFGVTHL